VVSSFPSQATRVRDAELPLRRRLPALRECVLHFARAPSIPDLLIAATAEKAGLTVLAVDKDFDLIVSVTGQPIETLST
jgi:predicted nucleic acid-binding protein